MPRNSTIEGNQMKTAISITAALILNSLFVAAHAQVLSYAQSRMAHLEIAGGCGSFAETHWNDSLQKPSKIDHLGSRTSVLHWRHRSSPP